MELYISPLKRQNNAVTGCFLKGHTPHNKGKKWEDYMDMRKAPKIKRIALKNLRPRLDIGGQNKRQVIGIKEGKIIGVWESAVKASEKLKLQRRNIAHCCQAKRKHCGGIRWFYEADVQRWITFLQN